METTQSQPVAAVLAHPSGLYRKAEVAAFLGVSIRTISRYVQSGLLRQRRLRSTLQPRYLGSDINKLLRTI